MPKVQRTYESLVPDVVTLTDRITASIRTTYLKILAKAWEEI